jgi:D-serine deaminase-like pyridoxal phosphate-dependent protein
MRAPSFNVRLPEQDELKARYIGAPIDSLPTPSVLIDQRKVLYNIEQMEKTICDWQCLLRVHIKTHKTEEGVALQLSGSQQHAIIVSTLAEAWGVVSSGLIDSGVVDDVSCPSVIGHA